MRINTTTPVRQGKGIKFCKQQPRHMPGLLFGGCEVAQLSPGNLLDRQIILEEALKFVAKLILQFLLQFFFFFVDFFVDLGFLST